MVRPVAALTTAVRFTNVRIGSDDAAYDSDAGVPPPPPVTAADADLPAKSSIGGLDSSQRASSSPGSVEFERHVREDDARRLRPTELLVPPRRPDTLVPEFRRVKRTHQLVRVAQMNPDIVQQKESLAQLPPAKPHPWVRHQPLGPNVVHGDGQIGVVGSGEVGFVEGAAWERPYPKDWRGLNHIPITGLTPPNDNGYVTASVTVRHSFQLTGRGLFANRDVKKGEPIMIVRSSAFNNGWNSITGRLMEMMRDVVLRAYHGGEAELHFVHHWILQGQMTSRVEYWPQDLTNQFILMIGGIHILDALEMHQHHVPRLACIIEMNSLVVESPFDAERGQAYFPEAGYLNHSCASNCDYEVLALEPFRRSSYADTLKDIVGKRSGQSSESAHGVERGGPTFDDAGIMAAAASGGRSSTAATAAGEDPHTMNAAQFEQQRSAASSGFEEPPAVTTEWRSSCGDASCRGCPADTTASSSVAMAVPGGKIEGLQQVPAAGTSVVRSGLPPGDHPPASFGPYFFCMTANRDIKQGEELLISYVPPEWHLEDRQFVLLDRYRFRCKCPKCAPTFDARYKYTARFGIGIIIFYCVLQLVLYRSRYDTRGRDDDNEDEPLKYKDIFVT